MHKNLNSRNYLKRENRLNQGIPIIFEKILGNVQPLRNALRGMG